MKNKHDNRSLPANRNYKDTIFRWLFSDKNNLLSLYNAIAGAHYQNPEALNIVTLENAVYMGMKNDLAFVLETGLYLYEHQSTYNPNIPLRDLFYIASEYQSLINQRTLYSSTLQTIPTPIFLVLYNGTDENIPDRLELRLSDAYENYSENPDLELKVTMLNINSDHNFELLKNCHVLWEYSQYVTRVRKYATFFFFFDAVILAITECIQEGILTEFLSHNRAEVLKVSIFEYDKEKEEKLIRKAEFDYGKAMGLADGVISLLEEKGRLSEDQINSIRRETRPEKQTEWFKLAIKVDTIDEFFKKANIKRQ